MKRTKAPVAIELHAYGSKCWICGEDLPRELPYVFSPYVMLSVKGSPSSGAHIGCYVREEMSIEFMPVPEEQQEQRLADYWAGKAAEREGAE